MPPPLPFPTGFKAIRYYISPLRRFNAKAMREGLFGGNRRWLVDSKRRHYLITLQAGGEFHSHKGVVRHDALIGGPEGTTVVSTRKEPYTALRPTLEDFVLLMPRGAQVIYPKDLGAILVLADVALGRYRVEVRDAYDGIDDGPFDRVVLDLPEPWQVVPHAEKTMAAGGILCAYTPSIVQASQ